MKKSEMFRMAQMAVLTADFISNEDKLETIPVLRSEEELQKLVEKREAEKESEESPY